MDLVDHSQDTDKIHNDIKDGQNVPQHSVTGAAFETMRIERKNRK